MNDLLRYRAMESMCRQRASFYPNEAWKFLAEAEMWHHRAMDAVSVELLTANVGGAMTPSAGPGAAGIAAGNALSGLGASDNRIVLSFHGHRPGVATAMQQWLADSCGTTFAHDPRLQPTPGVCSARLAAGPPGT